MDTSESEATMRTSRDTTGRRSRVERGIYRQPNGRYTVCFMLDGRPTFRTVGYDLDGARRERRAFVEAARRGVLASTPRLRFGQAAWSMSARSSHALVAARHLDGSG
jgi:hypothetical protein